VRCCPSFGGASAILPPARLPVSRIAVLPSAVADQIAAGEVVERPASAVKELVENAIDAGATSVEVDVEDGGRVLLRVSDDGIGMDAVDAPLALARHATSKIRVAQDLVGVASYGFRGEALPAICSVSRLALLTATDDGEGTAVRAAGGHVEVVEPTARRRGTTVEVRDLFYNLPARRKFLRSARSEWRAIADTLVTLSLTRPALRLRVTTDGREALVLAPASSLRARVAAVWGTRVRVPLRRGGGGARDRPRQRARRATRRCRGGISAGDRHGQRARGARYRDRARGGGGVPLDVAVGGAPVVHPVGDRRRRRGRRQRASREGRGAVPRSLGDGACSGADRAARVRHPGRRGVDRGAYVESRRRALAVARRGHGHAAGAGYATGSGRAVRPARSGGRGGECAGGRGAGRRLAPRTARRERPPCPR
jgi:DNA mismatch repair protein MutL